MKDRYAKILDYDSSEVFELKTRMQELLPFSKGERASIMQEALQFIEDKKYPILALAHHGHAIAFNVPNMNSFFQESAFLYSTTRNGDCRQYYEWVFATPTDIRDTEDNIIYKTPEDVHFIVKMKAGNPSSFGYLGLEEPIV